MWQQPRVSSGDEESDMSTHMLRAIIRMSPQEGHPTAPLVCCARRQRVRGNAARERPAPADLHAVGQKSPCNLSPL